MSNHTRYIARGIAVLFVCCIAAALGAPAWAVEYITFAVPGAFSTYPTAIAGNGDVAGVYNLTKGNHGNFTRHGFVRHADGTIETFDPPDSQNTYPAAIRGDGTIVGEYAIRLNHARLRGFMRSPDGMITAIRINHAKNVYPSDINAAGWVIGDYREFDNSDHAFLRAPDGSVTILQVPGAENTHPVSINKAGAIAGDFWSGNSTHGFVRNPDGSFVQFDVPKAAQTYPRSIDNAGRIVGSYMNRLYKSRAFLRDSGGKITKIDLPGNDQTFGVDLAAQSDGTAISIGYALDSNSRAVGYLRNGKGEITTFEAPGALDRGTFPTSMNGQTWIAGSYDAEVCYSVDCTHGFIRIP